MFRRLALLMLMIAPAATRASTIYEPLQVQFGNDRPYFYGGQNPLVHRLAASADALNRLYPVGEQRPRVFADFYLGQDAKTIHFDISDAFNQANASVPCYFRKGDLRVTARRVGRVATVDARTTDLPQGYISITLWRGRSNR